MKCTKLNPLLISTSSTSKIGCSTNSSRIHTRTSVKPNQSLVNLNHAPIDFNPSSALVYENFISPSQGDILQNEILQMMKRRKFEKGHWDAVISNYKEIELPSTATNIGRKETLQQTRFSLSADFHFVVDKVRQHIERTYFGLERNSTIDSLIKGDSSNDINLSWLPAHAIHLNKQGILSAHVDSVKFSGKIVAGLSLMSSAIMRLKPASPSEIDTDDINTNSYDAKSRKTEVEWGQSKSLNDAGHVDLLLPPLSLYVLSDMSRFLYTHELLESGSCFTDDAGNQTVVHRKDRISVIFRDAKI